VIIMFYCIECWEITYESNVLQRGECWNGKIITKMDKFMSDCNKSESVKVYKARYSRLVGKLLSLAHTRPDSAYAISVVRINRLSVLLIIQFSIDHGDRPT